MKVLKFGGSSLATFDLIKKVANNVKEKLQTEKKLIVVASAMGKTTNLLIENMKKTASHISLRELDQLCATGEMQSVSYLANALLSKGINAKSLSGWQAGILTNSNHTSAEILKVQKKKLEKLLKTYDVLVVAGFQGISGEEITTLGRGGSDTTAVALAGVLGWPCEIYTDVSGVYSIDPKIYEKAKQFKTISYDEMILLAKSGAKVLESKCSEIAKRKNVELYIGKSLEVAKNGTSVVKEFKNIKKFGVSSIALKQKMSLIKVILKGKQELSSLAYKLKLLGCDIIGVKQKNNLLSLCLSLDSSKVTEVKKNLSSQLFKIKNNLSKITLIGFSGKEEKQKVLEILKSSELPSVSKESLVISDNYVSFLTDSKSEIETARHFAEKFEI